MEFLVNLHSFWRYIVLIAAVVGLCGALGGWLGLLSTRLSARRAGTIYITALDIQFLLGLILWIIEGRWAVPGFFRFEHPTIMILAVAIAHIGQVMAKKNGNPMKAARTVALAVVVSLLFVIVGIPGVVRGP